MGAYAEPELPLATAGARLKIVVTESADREMVRVFFCTDPAMSPSILFASYSDRWAIEVCFRNLKQLLGFGDSPARKKQAVERIAPFVGLSYSMLVIWALGDVHTTPLVAPPTRPWYPHKIGLSFEDILRAARRVLHDPRVLDPAPDETIPTTIKRSPQALRKPPPRLRCPPQVLHAA